MVENIDSRVTKLEVAMIDALKLFDAYEKNMAELKREVAEQRGIIIDHHEKRLNSIYKMAEIQQEQTKSLQTSMIQMRDVYYHVFPERLKQDANVIRQFQAIQLKPGPDADPEDA